MWDRDAGARSRQEVSCLYSFLFLGVFLYPHPANIGNRTPGTSSPSCYRSTSIPTRWGITDPAPLNRSSSTSSSRLWCRGRTMRRSPTPPTRQPPSNADTTSGSPQACSPPWSRRPWRPTTRSSAWAGGCVSITEAAPAHYLVSSSWWWVLDAGATAAGTDAFPPSLLIRERKSPAAAGRWRPLDKGNDPPQNGKSSAAGSSTG